MVPQMMPIPIFIHHDDPTCPHCGKAEDTKTVCSHCGYEYTYSSSWWEDLFGYSIVLMVVFALFFVGFSIINWVTGKLTLWQEIQHSALWVWALLGRLV